jgi:hypothetical protein
MTPYSAKRYDPASDDPRFVQLVGELSLSSEKFRRLWARHDVVTLQGMPTRIHHPQLGDLTLSREKLAIGGAEGQMLTIYHAQHGTSDAEKLALLASGPLRAVLMAARDLALREPLVHARDQFVAAAAEQVGPARHRRWSQRWTG